MNLAGTPIFEQTMVQVTSMWDKGLDETALKQ
jgi:hypothetical protein